MKWYNYICVCVCLWIYVFEQVKWDSCIRLRTVCCRNCLWLFYYHLIARIQLAQRWAEYNYSIQYFTAETIVECAFYCLLLLLLKCELNLMYWRLAHERNWNSIIKRNLHQRKYTETKKKMKTHEREKKIQNGSDQPKWKRKWRNGALKTNTFETNIYTF